MNKKEIVSNTIDYIEQRLNKSSETGLSLDDIAEKIGYSKFYLNRIFHEIIGATIHQYIVERRLTEAAKKLVYTNESIFNIAYEAGYQSQQAFTNAFGTFYFVTPMDYRLEKKWIPLRTPYTVSQPASYHHISRLELAA